MNYQNLNLRGETKKTQWILDGNFERETIPANERALGAVKSGHER